MGGGPRQTPTKCMNINYESGVVGVLFIHLKIIDETYTACNALCAVVVVVVTCIQVNDYQYLYLVFIQAQNNTRAKSFTHPFSVKLGATTALDIVCNHASYFPLDPLDGIL